MGYWRRLNAQLIYLIGNCSVIFTIRFDLLNVTMSCLLLREEEEKTFCEAGREGGKLVVKI